MPDSYDYAVVRVVPRVDREEFINVGVLLSCEAREFLAAGVALDEARLRAFSPDVDVALVQRHLAALCRVAAGGPAAGPIGALPRRARFHWLAATRSALVQTSVIHMGFTADPAATLARLVERMVASPSSGPSGRPGPATGAGN